MNPKLLESITYLDDHGIGFEVTYLNKDYIVLWTQAIKPNEELEEQGFVYCGLPGRYKLMIKK